MADFQVLIWIFTEKGVLVSVRSEYCFLSVLCKVLEEILYQATPLDMLKAAGRFL